MVTVNGAALINSNVMQYIKNMRVKINIWSAIGGIVGLLLLAVIVVNLIHEEYVPRQISLFLFGSLVAVGIAYSVVNRRSSPVILKPREEARFRKKQYAIGIVFSVVLTLLFILTDFLDAVLAWLFAPIIMVPYALLIRHYIRGR
ncbi:MAG: hypothetical protein JRF56_19155 [Deltaproteobacteria bacterium]|nr:hypothetical protein [Deltaproteobacteria bacterium]